jgi:hypothetical protein
MTSKVDMKKNSRKHYLENKEAYIARARAFRARTFKFFMRYKGLISCAHCGFLFKGREECCDFHHIDSDGKDANVSALVAYGIPRVKAEIRKCIPLCANCHRTVHRGLKS